MAYAKPGKKKNKSKKKTKKKGKVRRAVQKLTSAFQGRGGKGKRRGKAPASKAGKSGGS